MEDFFKQAMLYDFYGDLLTDHQKEVYESYIQENLSLSEIAEEENVSRQAVHDIIKRSREQLETYEDKLHLVERFLEIKKMVAGIDECTDLDSAKKIAAEIVDKL